MKTWVFRFSADELRSLHPDHLGFILASSHCCNELTAILPFLIFDKHIDDATETEDAILQVRFFTIVRFQIAKIFEYRDLCNKYISKARKTFPDTADKIGKRFKSISRLIKSATWAETVRNKVAFHFDAAHALDALKHLSPDHELRFYVGRMRGLTVYDFADRALVAAMFFDAGSGDPEKGADVVRTWTLQLNGQITDFHAQTLQELFEHHGLMKRRDEVELRDQYCAVPGTTFIPLSSPDHHEQRQ